MIVSTITSWVSRSRAFLEGIRDSFWAIPCCLLLAAGCLAIVNLWLDTHLSINQNFGQIIGIDLDLGSRENYRSVHSTTAAAILGVAGVSFSITIASLTLASQQFGPRLIRTFIRDRFIQTTLGFFVSTFFYCMLTMQLGSFFTDDGYVPIFSLVSVLVLTFVDLLLLVLFINHICVAIQVDSVINEVVTEMNERVEILFEEQSNDTGLDSSSQIEAFHRKFENNSTELTSKSDGYITFIDYDSLCAQAAQKKLHLSIPFRAGEYVMTGSVLIKSTTPVEPDTSLSDLLDCVIISKTRTPAQDLEYTIRQLVEIALRALSPGINDPFTAMTCIDHLGAILNVVASRAIPASTMHDAEGNFRLLRNQTSYEGLVGAAFNQIRQAACDRVDVTMRLLEVFSNLQRLCQNTEQAKVISQQAKLVVAGVASATFLEHDQEAIGKRHEDFLAQQQNLFKI